MLDQSRILAFSGRLYTLLLLAYPTRFRRAYGREMAQVFRDDIRDTFQESGPAGLINLWFLVILDLLKTALAEHVWEVFHMPMEKLQRWSGPAAAIAGLLWISSWLIEADMNVRFLLWVPALLFMAVGLAGFYRRLPTNVNSGNGLAFGVALIGLLLMLAGVLGIVLTNAGLDLAWTMLVVGFLWMIVGIGVMGGIAISKRALGRLSFIPLAQAAFLLAIFLTGGESGPDPAQITFSVLYGICWILLGFALWRSTGEDAPGPAIPA